MATDRSNRADGEFLLADIETAHAFLDVAGTSDAAQARLDVQRARELLNAVSHRLAGARIEPARRSRIEAELGELRIRLSSLKRPGVS